MYLLTCKRCMTCTCRCASLDNVTLGKVCNKHSECTTQCLTPDWPNNGAANWLTPGTGVCHEINVNESRCYHGYPDTRCAGLPNGFVNQTLIGRNKLGESAWCQDGRADSMCTGKGMQQTYGHKQTITHDCATNVWFDWQICAIFASLWLGATPRPPVRTAQ